LKSEEKEPASKDEKRVKARPTKGKKKRRGRESDDDNSERSEEEKPKRRAKVEVAKKEPAEAKTPVPAMVQEKLNDG